MCTVVGKRRDSDINVTGLRPPLATRHIAYTVCCWSLAQIILIYFRGYLSICVINKVHCTKHFRKKNTCRYHSPKLTPLLNNLSHHFIVVTHQHVSAKKESFYSRESVWSELTFTLTETSIC